MEYMDGGSLDLILKKTGKIPEKYSRKINLAVLRGEQIQPFCLLIDFPQFIKLILVQLFCPKISI